MDGGGWQNDLVVMATAQRAADCHAVALAGKKLRGPVVRMPGRAHLRQRLGRALARSGVGLLLPSVRTGIRFLTNLLVVGMLLFFAGSLRADPQGMPTELGDIFRSAELKPGVNRITLQTDSQRRFFWAGTRREDGYLELDPIVGYDKVIRSFLSNGLKPELFNSNSGISCALAGNNPVVSVINESPYRTTTIFALDGGDLAMLTVWYFGRKDSQIVVISDFINNKINGMDATLAFVKPEANSKKRGIWKIGWSSEDVEYELHVGRGEGLTVATGAAAGALADQGLQAARFNPPAGPAPNAAAARSARRAFRRA